MSIFFAVVLTLLVEMPMIALTSVLTRSYDGEHTVTLTKYSNIPCIISYIIRDCNNNKTVIHYVSLSKSYIQYISK